MSVGQVRVFPVHLGKAFTTSQGYTYLLCDGSSYARSTYPVLSQIWPSGAYGSTTSNIHLPDLKDIALRGQTVVFNGTDPDVASRTALSGVLPVTSGIGSFQTGQMKLHTHLDSQTTSTAEQQNNSNSKANPNYGDVPTTATIASGYASSTTNVTISGSVSTATVLPHTKVYFYITAK